MPAFVRPFVSWSAAVFLLTLVMTAASFAGAGGKVQFDVERVVACRDVTTPEFANRNPNEKLIAVPLSVSCLFPPGSEGDVYELLYRVRTRERSQRVLDYLPRTTMGPVMAGNIGVQAEGYERQSMSFHAKGQYPFFASGEAAGAYEANQMDRRSYELLPPLELLAASGTIDRGTGVFFKLLPSQRSALEGSKDFLVVLRVPRGWRSDYLLVTCQQCRTVRDVPFIAEDRMECGGTLFLVGLHLEGDEEARAVAQRFSDAETRLRETVTARREAIRHRQYPTPLHQVAGLWDSKPTRSVESWLEEMLLQEVLTSELSRQLPADVVYAAKLYRAARSRLLATAEPRSVQTTAVVRRLPR